MKPVIFCRFCENSCAFWASGKKLSFPKANPNVFSSLPRMWKTAAAGEISRTPAGLPAAVLWKEGDFGGCFPKFPKKMSGSAEKRNFVRFLRNFPGSFEKIQRKAKKNRGKTVRNPQFIHKSTRVFNNLWKTDLKTFHGSDR